MIFASSNKALIRSLNQRVAVISETLDTFGSLKFMCECGIYACRKRIELTASSFEAGSHVVVETRVSAAARLAVATDPRDASEEPLALAALL